jgi:hypothetical protein
MLHPAAAPPPRAAQPTQNPGPRSGCLRLSALVHTLVGMTSLPTSRLEELIEQATVDCANASEQVCGLFTQLEEALATPFQTTVLGVQATVTAVDLTADDDIVALVRRGSQRQRFRLLDLTLPDPPPAGTEWIHAYRRWATRNGRA